MHNFQQPQNAAVALAILALDGNVHPLDMDTPNIGEGPTDLDIQEEQPPGRKGVVPLRVGVADNENRGKVVQ